MTWKAPIFAEILETTPWLEAIIQISPEGFPLAWESRRGSDAEIEALSEMALAIWSAACRADLTSEGRESRLALTTPFGGMSLAQGDDLSLLLLLTVGQEPQPASELIVDLTDSPQTE